MGALDMFNLLVFCMIDGVMGMLGSVYCSAPNFLYLKGAITMGNFSVLYNIIVGMSKENKRDIKFCGEG